MPSRRCLCLLWVLSSAVISSLGAQAPDRAAQSALYFPPANGDWATVSAGETALTAAALDETLDFARDVNSTSVVVLQNGRIVAERNWQPEGVARVGTTSDGAAIEDVASLQKSVIALLIGIAEERKLVARAAPVSKYLGQGWSKAPPDVEARITINHLLTMTSGLSSDLTSEAAPGARWFYNTPAYSRLIRVLSTVTGKDPNVYTNEWLATRIGMTHTRWIARDPGLPAAAQNPYGLATTARDMARIGLLVLAGGVWRDTRLIDASYVREMTQPSQTLNPSYGLLWYANRRMPEPMIGSLDLPMAPADLIAGQGAAERRVYIVPSRSLVITRLGAASPGLDRELWTRLARALDRRRRVRRFAIWRACSMLEERTAAPVTRAAPAATLCKLCQQ